jgi:hypothetical protein
MVFRQGMSCGFLLAASVAALGGAAWAAKGGGDAACLECHSGGNLGKPELDVDAKVLHASLHGAAGLSCTDCHADLVAAREFPHGKTGPPACGTCHDAERQAVERSAHRQNDAASPRCWSCHGGHDVLKAGDKASKVAPLNQPTTCLRCHADTKLAADHGLPVRESPEAFQRSTHYQQLLSGNGAAPTCTTCHGAHDNVSHRDANSPIARRNVASTCGMCHSGIADQFLASVHGVNLTKANADVPTCTGCHSEHSIRGPKDPSSPVYPTHVATTCSHCHENERLASQYGIAAARLQTFTGSYHGAASRFGDATVANCASCHGAHDIRPSGDPKSSINPSNLTRTCGKCHPQAGLNFASGKIHVRDLPEDNYWAWMVKRVYLSMIWSVIGGFVALILLDLWWRARTRWSARGRA